MPTEPGGWTPPTCTSGTASGALPLLEAATGDHPPLSYIGPDGFGRLRGRPEVQRPGAVALDDDAVQAIWDIGVRQTRTDLG